MRALHLVAPIFVLVACEPRSQPPQGQQPLPGAPPQYAYGYHGAPPGPPAPGYGYQPAPAPQPTAPPAPAPAPTMTTPPVVLPPPAPIVSAPSAPLPAPPPAGSSAPLPPGGTGKHTVGQACSVHKDCQSGTCEGEGCGFGAGRCVSPDRMCTRDLVGYCGCDGKTFHASGTCPARVYRHKGICK